MKNPFPVGSAEAFFFDNAAYSYDPKTETRKQGLMRCARSMARAERHARDNGWEFLWDSDWDIGSHVKEFGRESYPEEPSTCEFCQLRDANDNILASLGCIDDADANYRRVIEAELASEALGDEGRALLREFEVESFINRCFAL